MYKCAKNVAKRMEDANMYNNLRVYGIRMRYLGRFERNSVDLFRIKLNNTMNITSKVIQILYDEQRQLRCGRYPLFGYKALAASNYLQFCCRAEPNK